LTCPSVAYGYHVVSPQAHVDITTDKITHIDEITESGTILTIAQLEVTASMPGPRVVLIDSYGGIVEYGKKIVEALRAEKSASHEKVICVVTGHAQSMAFNILSQACDVRLGMLGADYMFHAQFYFMIRSTEERKLNPAFLRELADEIEKDDAPFRDANAKAMHMTLKEYDKYRDEEKT